MRRAYTSSACSGVHLPKKEVTVRKEAGRMRMSADRESADFFAEREDGGKSQFEVLKAPGKAYDCYAE